MIDAKSIGDKCHRRDALFLGLLVWIFLIAGVLLKTYFSEYFDGLRSLSIHWAICVVLGLWAGFDARRFGWEQEKRCFHAVLVAMTYGVWVIVYLVKSRGLNGALRSAGFIALVYLLVSIVVWLITDLLFPPSAVDESAMSFLS